MAVGIDPKPPKQRFDQHRLVRKKLKAAPATLGGDAAEVMLYWGLSEREYRAKLWNEFAAFCRQNSAWAITPPHEGRVRVQLAEGSMLLDRLAPLQKKYPVAILSNPSHRLTHGRFVPVTEIQVTLWR
jgi:hypothetical protein